MRKQQISRKIIGINNRNLKDFSIDLNTTKKLKKMVPSEVVLVSESGVTNEEDVKFLKEIGVDALLIGTALMESENPCELAKSWKR